MTREEALNVLCHENTFVENFKDVSDEKCMEALEIAVRCVDFINRLLEMCKQDVYRYEDILKNIELFDLDLEHCCCENCKYCYETNNPRYNYFGYACRYFNCVTQLTGCCINYEKGDENK